MSYLFARSCGRGGFSAARRAFSAAHCWSNSSYGASNNAASAADEIPSKLMHQRSSVRRVRSRPVIQRHTTSELLAPFGFRSEEHTSELQSLMRISYAVFCLKKKT